jgi:hypothetical protein
MTFPDGWLGRQIDRAAQEVATWPEWLKKETGIRQPSTSSQSNEPEEKGETSKRQGR